MVFSVWRDGHTECWISTDQSLLVQVKFTASKSSFKSFGLIGLFLDVSWSAKAHPTHFIVLLESALRWLILTWRSRLTIILAASSFFKTYGPKMSSANKPHHGAKDSLKIQNLPSKPEIFIARNACFGKRNSMIFKSSLLFWVSFYIVRLFSIPNKNVKNICILRQPVWHHLVR